MENEEISFGPFWLDLRRPELRRDGQPVRIHRRALGILCALAEAKGEIVGKDELMARLWPGRIVEEGNLHVHVSALRKSLDEHGKGHSFVVTVPGRGYRLADLTGLRSAQLAEGSLPLQLPQSDKPSIAVMPFANLSGDPDQEYFADGMVEEIITALSRIRWLFVIARNSSFTYKGQAVDVKQIGRELGVRYVLEGSVRKGGGRVRISVQLIEAEGAAHLWADHFDGSLEDVLDLQDQVAISVAGVIEPALRVAEIRRAVDRPRHDRSLSTRASGNRLVGEAGLYGGARSAEPRNRTGRCLRPSPRVIRVVPYGALQQCLDRRPRGDPPKGYFACPPCRSQRRRRCRDARSSRICPRLLRRGY